MKPIEVACPVAENDPSQHTPFCPICGDQFLVLGGQWRCRRCHFRLCESCEGYYEGENAFSGNASRHLAVDRLPP